MPPSRVSSGGSIVEVAAGVWRVPLRKHPVQAAILGGTGRAAGGPVISLRLSNVPVRPTEAVNYRAAGSRLRRWLRCRRWCGWLAIWAERARPWPARDVALVSVETEDNLHTG